MQINDGVYTAEEGCLISDGHGWYKLVHAGCNDSPTRYTEARIEDIPPQELYTVEELLEALRLLGVEP